ncbi:helix-turn-helix transcriptional regulator [Natrarchaeobaculum aegyptiacum]|uniref:ArsR family transcriptional regulator n=1 Tax=Natrarchaeobaculum aegyptiacum TaxID=745377 RepID=A0A2Z2HT25_9EURY|nr:ArsR family transcriptional regulator [Natrarchaeobaculum aegyptiacum]ARS90339.1 ArsR family transcriptional regulator [Natrarchaeobaculum aegyptiacum]
MDAALEEIEFLARSPNRVEVLRLCAAGPSTRSELADETGVSQATLGRILGDFADRSWITRDGSQYEATVTGRLVAAAVSDLLAALETERRLRDVVEYLPTDGPAADLDPRHLADATITTPSRTRPGAPLNRLLEFLPDAETVRTVSHAFNEQTLDVVETQTAAGEQTFTGVFTYEAIDALRRDDELRGRLEQLLGHESAAVSVVEAVPVAVMTVDDVVYVLLRDDEGILRGSIDTDDPDVRMWAEDLIDEYVAEARELSPADIVDGE